MDQTELSLKIAIRCLLSSLLILTLIHLSGCETGKRGRMSSAGESSTDSIPPNSRAFDMVRTGKSFEEYMAVQMEAVEQLRKGHPQSDAVEILSQTGHFLMRHGDYVEALEYLYEASDSVERRLERGSIDKSMIVLYNNLASLYVRFGLFELALDGNAKAIEVSTQMDKAYATDLWRMRSAIFSEYMQSSEDRAEMADSVLLCIEKAFEMIPNAPLEIQDTHRMKCGFERACLFVENPDLFPDSISVALEILKPNYDGSSFATSANVVLGRAMVLMGRDREGLELMERGLSGFHKQNWKEGIEWTLKLLAQSYAEAGQGDKLAAIYPELKSAETDMMNRIKINTLAGAEFKHRLRDKQREVDSLKKENEKSGRIILLGGFVLILGLFTGAFVTVTYLKLRSRSRQERENHRQEISDILSRQVILNKEIERLNEQLQQKEHGDVIERVVEQIDPSLLNGEDETKFRRAFMSLHPHLLKKLRSEYPGLTSSDELLCMLIYLKVPSIDMAASLGISRPSLNSARYRLRKRLNLDKDTDLDQFIQSK